MYLKDKLNDLPFEYDINSEINIKDILKILSLKLNTDEYQTILGKVMFLIDITSEFELNKILIFNNIKTYLEDEELIKIYKYTMHKNISLLLIENQNNKILKYERKIIIDSQFDNFLQS